MTTRQHSGALPELLLDRSLGSIAVPALLRAAGLRVHTLVDVYGSAAEAVEDAEWLGYAGQRGWPVLLRDPHIRRRAVERAVITAHGVRAFCLGGAHLEPAVLADRFLSVLDAVALACARPGPALYLITASGMRSVSGDR
jgi:hypothetical protein